MRLDEALTIWGAWKQNGECIDTASMYGAITSPEVTVQAGEVTKKQGTITIYDDTIPKELDRLIDELPERQREVITVEYAGNDNTCNMIGSLYLGLTIDAYKSALKRSKQYLRIRTRYY